MNIINNLSESGMKNMWSRIKEFKVNLLSSKKDKIVTSCNSPSSYSSLNADAFLKYELIDEFIQNFTVEVNMTDDVLDPVDVDNISDLSLKVAAAMFFYLRKCPHGGDGFGYKLVEKINKFFEIGSARTIWETVSNVYKNSVNNNHEDIDFSQNGLENILDILSNEINSSLAELEVFTLTNSTFAVYKNDNVFGNISRQTPCLNSTNRCTEGQLSKIKEQQRFVNHPVHIIDDTEKISPSSFIPFCSLGGKMSEVGHSIPGFSVPICNSFKPYNLLGQVQIYLHNVESP